MATIRHGLRRMMRDQSGKILIMALVALVVGALLLTPLLGLMSAGLMGGQVYEQKMHELYAADAGVEDAIHWLINGRPEHWGWEVVVENQEWTRFLPTQINGKDVTVTIEDLGDHEYMVTSTALDDSTHGTTVQSYLRAIAFKVIDGCHDYNGPGDIAVGTTHIKGDASITVNAKVTGDLIVDGDLTMTQGGSTIEGDVSVKGSITLTQGSGEGSGIIGNVCTDQDLTMHQNTHITGNVLVGGDITMYNNATIDGNVFIQGDVIFEGQGTITGNVYAYGDITVYIKHPQAAITGAVYATGTATVNPSNRSGRVMGGTHDECDPELWEPPPCPEIPVSPTGIHTYDIFGYSG